MKQEGQQRKNTKVAKRCCQQSGNVRSQDQSKRMSDEMIKQLSDGEKRKVDILFY
jgi:hypothetical protein